MLTVPLRATTDRRPHPFRSAIMLHTIVCASTETDRLRDLRERTSAGDHRGRKARTWNQRDRSYRTMLPSW
jgi:hypothetical protein